MLMLLTILVAACPTPRDGMRCVESDGEPAFLIDDDLATKGKVDHQTGKKLCLSLGKELPTDKQRAAAGGEKIWTLKPLRPRALPPPGLAHVRCVLTTGVLLGHPAKIARETRAPPPLPAPPTEAQRALAHDVKDDVLSKQTCENKGRSFMDCRDPASYIKTNEPRQHLWRPYVENLGGGYTGVGIDQNYTFITAQRAEWAWLFDYDPTIVRLHRVLKALIIAADDREAFIAMFDDKNAKAAAAAIENTWRGHAELKGLVEVYRLTRKTLKPYYQRQRDGVVYKEDKTWGWLATEDAYAYVRALYQQDRIVIVKGDMLANNAMQSIGKAARDVGAIIRVYYPSNAPEFWPHNQNYKDNVNALPMDAMSIVIQTSSGVPPGYGNKRGYWHYNVQGGQAQQALLRQKEIISVRELVDARHKTDDPDLTICHLERATSTAPPPSR